MPKKGHRQNPEHQSQQQANPRRPASVRLTGGYGNFHAVALLVICGLTAAIYSNSLKGEFVFDDHIAIDKNRFITDVTELDWQRLLDAATKSRSPRPVANISFALNHRFGGLNVTGYHLVNIVVHILAGICVYFLAHVTYRLLFSGQGAGVGSQGSGDRSPPSTLDTRHSTLDTRIAWMSLFAACVFVAHPVQTQAVTYIVQRMTSMATMFYLASLLLYIYGRISEQGVRRWLLWTGCLITWVLALGSKQIAATLPLAIVLYEWYFFQDLSRLWLRRSLKYFVGLAVVLAFVTLISLGMNPWQRIQEGYEIRDFTVGERLLTQPRVVIHYIGLIALPLPSRLNLLHHVSTSQSLVDPISTLFSCMAILGLGGLAVYFARRERLISFCILWFLLNLVIESSVIGLEMVFEHRLYLPMFAFALALPYLMYRLLSKPPAVAVTISVLMIVAFGTGTYIRNRAWQDETVVWSDVIDKNPREYRAHNLLGLALQERGKIGEAIQLFNQALDINPDDPETHNNLGVALEERDEIPQAITHYLRALQIKPRYAAAHNNLGLLYQEQGKIDKAIEHFQHAVQCEPEFAMAHVNLGATLRRQGNIDQAIDQYQLALKIRPRFAEAHYNLAIALQQKANIAEAIEHYRLAVRLNPDLSQAHNNLGILLQGQNKYEEAIKHFLEAVRKWPDYAEAHNNLGSAYLAQNNFMEAIQHFREALRIMPDFSSALDGLGKTHNQLGIALQGQGKTRESIQNFLQAVRLIPDFAEAQYNLGVALQQQGKFSEAIRQYEKAVRIKPEYAEAHNNLGVARRRQGDLATAIVHFRRAADLKTDFVLAHNNLSAALDTLAAAHAKAGRYDEAIEAATEAIAAARAAENQKLAREIGGRLESYRNRIR